ncbi:HotDog domain-containing protein, partial [Syncephalis pseudoplumigaleata]
RVIFEFKVLPRDCNYAPTVHGSLLALLVDNCTTTMLYTLPNYYKWGGLSVNMNLNYHKPALPGQVIIIDAYSEKQGKKVTFTAAKI